MKPVTSVLFSIVLVISLSSCSSTIFVQKTYAPELDAGKKPCKIVFINLFDYTSSAYVRDKHENAYHAGVMSLAKGLSSFSKDESFSFLFGDTLKKEIPAGQLTILLPKDSILAISERFKSDLLLTLDSLNIFFDWETIVNDDGGGREKTKNFYLCARSYLSLYSAAGDLVNRSMIDKSSFYKSRATLTALITIKPSIANAVRSIEPLLFESGLDYVSKFYPTTVPESRTLYGGKAFKESNRLIKIRNWDKAAELLEQLAKSPNANTAVKARHNLSVVKEAQELEKQ